MAEPNPNGANGTTSDPREQIMWDIYVRNLTSGLDNAYAAAIEAGYSEDSARNVTMRDWFKARLGKLKRKEIFSDSEKLLHKTINYSHVDKEGNIKVDLLRVQADVAKTMVKTLGKDEGYSERTEHTGKDGEPIKIIQEDREKIEKALDTIL